MSQRDEVIAGRYLLLERIGAGGMGQVWRAHDQRLGREVAVKQLHTQRGVSEEDAEVWNHRAMREARITARLHHQHAVPVFDVVEHDGQPCLIMQYFPSSSLAEILAGRGPLPVPEVARIGSEVAAALATAHQVGIVHRDVKPGNLLIADDGTAKITDFGIAHARGDVSLTSAGMVTGTPAYLAPEVAKGVRATPASDVFSLGSTLYAAIEGQPPFGTGDNAIALLHRVATGDLPPPQRAGALTPVLLRMLAARAEDRPGMAEVARTLGALVDEGDRSTRVAAQERDAVTAPVQAAAPVEAAQDAPPVAGPVAVAAAGAAGAAAAHRASPRPERVDPSPPPPSTPGGLDALWPAREEPDPVPDPVRDGPEGAPRRRRNLLLVGLLAVAAAALVFGLQALGEDPQGAAGPQATGSPSSARTSPTASPTGSATTPEPSATPEPTPTPEPSTTRSSPPASEGTARGGAPTADRLEQAVEDYYALLPDDTDAGYALLTDRYRDKEAGSFRSYTGFWSTIADVRVSDVTATGPGSVAATVRYEDDEGAVSRERRSYRLIEVDGVLKIDDSAVIG